MLWQIVQVESLAPQARTYLSNLPFSSSLLPKFGDSGGSKVAGNFDKNLTDCRQRKSHSQKLSFVGFFVR